MLGRSSRTRDVCEGVLYSSTSEKPSQIVERMKSSEIQPLLEMETLLPVLESKRDDRLMIKTL
jgi:hypothetical protein